LQDPFKGNQTHKKEAGKQDETKDEKGRPQVGDLPDKREGNQSARHCSVKEGIAPIDVRYFLRLGRLQGVVFRRHHGDELRGQFQGVLLLLLVVHLGLLLSTFENALWPLAQIA
jgi:hypothetical protein